MFLLASYFALMLRFSMVIVFFDQTDFESLKIKLQQSLKFVFSRLFSIKFRGNSKFTLLSISRTGFHFFGFECLDICNSFNHTLEILTSVAISSQSRVIFEI